MQLAIQRKNLVTVDTIISHPALLKIREDGEESPLLQLLSLTDAQGRDGLAIANDIPNKQAREKMVKKIKKCLDEQRKPRDG